jgi:hypothetical protein
MWHEAMLPIIAQILGTGIDSVGSELELLQVSSEVMPVTEPFFWYRLTSYSGYLKFGCDSKPIS